MPRVAAWKVLRSGVVSPLRSVDRAALERNLDERDRALLRRLVGIEVRHRATLRTIVQYFSPRKLKPDLLVHAHLGVAQLLWFDRIPAHAVLATSAAAAGETCGPSKAAPVRAVVRNVLRALSPGKSGDPRRDLVDRDLHLRRDVFSDPKAHPLLWFEELLNIPARLAKRWTKHLGPERARELGLRFLREPELSLVCLGATRDALGEELRAAGIETNAAAHARVLLADAAATAAVTESAAFREGRLTIQGESALGAAELVEAQAGERILDLCAAPGGKASVLAQMGASVLALDILPRRLERACDGWQRTGVRERIQPVAADGARALGTALLDAVLIDAPCSNTGVLGARPAARWRWGPKSQASLHELQARLLEEGAAHVRPGGRLVWSTCSLEPEENQQLVRAFLGRHGGWELELERLSLPLASEASGPRAVDGGFAARLRRRR